MNIDFKKWQTNLLQYATAHGRSKQALLQDIRKILEKFKPEIDKQNFQKVFEFIYDSSSTISNRCFKASFITCLILQQDMSALKDLCTAIAINNRIPGGIFAFCSFDEFSNQKLGFDVSKVMPDAFRGSEVNKFDINGKLNLSLYDVCFAGIKSNCVIHVSAGRDLYIYSHVFDDNNLYELKLKAANIHAKTCFIDGSTIDTLIIDAENLIINDIGRWIFNTFSINRLVISKEIVDQWGEKKIWQVFKPNILEIL